MSRSIPVKKKEEVVPFNLKIPVSLDAKLRQYATDNGVPITSIILSGIMSELAGGDTQNKTDIAFDLSGEEKAALQKLADDVKVGDSNVFVKMLTRLAIERGADATVRFMFEQLEEKTEQRAKDEAKKKAQPRTRGAQQRNAA